MQFFLKPAFGLSIVLAFMAVITSAVPVTDTSDVSSIMSGLKTDANGIVVLCGDGVVRSITHDLTVLAYKKLDTAQIQKVIDRYGRDDKLTKMYDGVNGNDVTDDEQLYHPSEELLPKSFGSELATKRDALGTSKSTTAPSSIFKKRYGPGSCDEEKCYGVGNCTKNCHGCFTPAPGYQGNCTT